MNEIKGVPEMKRKYSEADRGWGGRWARPMNYQKQQR